MAVLGRWARGKLEEDCKNFQTCQEKLLRDLLEKNKDTLFGRYCCCLHVSTVIWACMTTSSPRFRYETYRSYIEKMRTGEDSKALTTDAVDLLAATSGTSGNRFPEAVQLQKTCKLTYLPSYSVTESGLRIGPNSSSPGDKSFQRLLPLYSTPKAAYMIRGDEPAALYLHTLFALRDRKLGILEANFSSIVYTLFAQISRTPRQLVRDLATGKIDPEICGRLPPETRAELEGQLSPNPVRAKEVAAALGLSDDVILKTGSNITGESSLLPSPPSSPAPRPSAMTRDVDAATTGLARKLWPDMKLLLCVSTGAFSLYAEKMEETFTKGIPNYSPIYGATEGLIAVNLHPPHTVAKAGATRERKTSLYTLVPRAMVRAVMSARAMKMKKKMMIMRVFEFIDTKDMHLAQPPTRSSREVKVGEEYELVMTNLSGFCRYRFVNGGWFVLPRDAVVVRVVVGGVPVPHGADAQRARRKDLGDYGHGVDQKRVFEILPHDEEYLHRDAAATPHYVVFVELEDGSKLTGTDVKALDLEIQRSNPIYKSFRVKGAIEPARVVQVNSGAFLGLRDTLIAGGGAANQLKIPRVLRRKADVDLLWNEKCS
eukprot:jgi/Bigna1/141095/aug1.60_g15803